MPCVESTASLNSLQTMARNIDETMDPLVRQGQNYERQLTQSIISLLNPETIDAIVADRLSSLARSLPSTAPAVRDADEKFGRARQLLDAARSQVLQAAQLIDASLKALSLSIVEDKRRALSNELDRQAQHTRMPVLIDTSCYLCAGPLQPPVAWIERCHCHRPAVTCLQCVERHVYMSTDGSRKTQAKCSFCRHEFTLDCVRVAG
jgi:hypothetical protein